MSQGQRERALASFALGLSRRSSRPTSRSPRARTCPDITHVINYDPPRTNKGYVHRVGPHGPRRRSGVGSPSSCPSKQADVGRVAGRLGHGEAVRKRGMHAGRAKLVYSGRRRTPSRW